MTRATDSNLYGIFGPEGEQTGGGVYSGLSSLASLAEGAYSLKNCRKSSLVMHRLYGVFRPVSVSSCGAPERHLTKAAQTHHAFASKK